VMDNHFHILAKVPNREKWLERFEGEEGERRLLKHLATLYSKKFIAQLERELREFREQGNEGAAGELIEKFMKRFCDVSVFMKELKERFSRWFNKQQGRRGTLWMDRFKSVLVDGEEALATMAAYIDLNPVRAGIVENPLEYEWSNPLSPPRMMLATTSRQKQIPSSQSTITPVSPMPRPPATPFR
jgi:putative transposase